MRILAIDTSGAAGSVAAVDDEGAAERGLGPAGGHARLLTAVAAAAAADRGWDGSGPPLGRLGPDDVVAVVRGPGSFTGLRVGVTAAKALAWASGARLVGVSGFDVIAQRTERLAGRAAGPLAIAYDAGRGEVFAASATRAADGWVIGTPALLPVGEWLASLPAGGMVTGPALAGIAAQRAARADVPVAPPEAWRPAATDAAAVARGRAAAGAFDDPNLLVPDYLRPSYAEERGTGGGG